MLRNSSHEASVCRIGCCYSLKLRESEAAAPVGSGRSRVFTDIADMATAAFGIGIALVVVSGIALSFQSGINATLGQKAGSGGFAAVISFSLGLTACAVFFLIEAKGFGKTPTAASLASKCAGSTIYCAH